MYLYGSGFRMLFEGHSTGTSWLRGVCVSKNALDVILIYLDSSCARVFSLMLMSCDSLFT